MSVVEKLSKLFSKKSDEAQAETSGDLSLGAPEATAHMSTASMDVQASEHTLQESVEPDSIDDSVAPLEGSEEADLISVPLLGRRSVVIHQRVLFTLLTLSLVVLGAVAFFAVARAVLRRVATEGALVPSTWRLEVANVLRNAVRRGRCHAGYAERSLRRLGRLRISVDTETDRHAWGATRELSREHNLALYDAAYLELAVRRRQALASQDAALLKAAAGHRADGRVPRRPCAGAPVRLRPNLCA